MYFVNRSDIEQILEFFDSILKELEQKKLYTSDLIYQLALERIIHVMIESILDVGNKMIDGFIMRDPGSYHDIIDILIDEKVIPQEDEQSYKKLIDARQMVVREYHHVDLNQLHDVILKNQTVFNHFSTHIRSYLDSELGVANTFTNKLDKEDK